MAKKKSDNYWEPHAKILPRMKRFQREVLKFRRAWNIPDTGLKQDDIYDWQTNLVETDPSPLSEEQLRYAGWDYYGPVVHGRFWQALTDLCTSFNLDQRWIAPIYMYVLGGRYR